MKLLEIRKRTKHEKRYQRLDITVAVALLALLIISCIMVYSASIIGNKYGLFTKGPVSETFFLFRQSIWAVGSYIIFLIMAMVVPFEVLKNEKVQKMAAIFIGLLLISTRFFGSINGAALWIRLGFFSFQPSTIAQVFIIIYLATILERRKNKLMQVCTPMELLDLFIIPFILVGIIFTQNDTGTLAITMAVIMIMIMCSNMHVKNIRKILKSFLGALVIAVVLYLTYSSLFSKGGSYRVNRFKVFLNPFSEDLKGSADQIINSFIAFGNGGLFGRGIGNSVQKLGYLAEAHTDFILAVIAEELGLIGVVFVLGLIITIIGRVLNTGTKSNSTFSAMYTIGFASLLLVQMIVNAGGVTASMPMTGVPLPFVSSGGSSLFVLSFGLGIAMNILAHIKYIRKNKV